MTTIRITALFALLNILTTFPIVAQDKPRHDRFWWAFGLGGGWNAINVDFEPTTRRWQFDFDGPRGASAYFRLGGTVNQHVLFGGEAFVFWREGQSGQDLERVNANAIALIYPGAEGGLFFKGGFGVASSEGPRGDESGVGTTLGAGFDLRIGTNIFVTPNIDVMVQMFEESTNASLLFTMGFTWH